MANSWTGASVSMPAQGGVYDPVMAALKQAGPVWNNPGTNSQANAMMQADSNAYFTQQNHPMFQQQNMFKMLPGLLNSFSGMSQGPSQGAGLGDFEGLFNRVKDPLMNSLMPGEDKAREQIKNRILAEGGANALSSGQGMAAMGSLEGELGAVREAALAKALMDAMGGFVTMRGQDTQLQASQNQMRYQLLNAIMGPAMQSMFS